MPDTSFRIQCLCNADFRSNMKDLIQVLDLSLQDATDYYFKFYMKRAAGQGDPLQNIKQG